MDMREAFEETMVNLGYFPDGWEFALGNDGQYLHRETRIAFAAWQAALSHIGDGSKAEPVAWLVTGGRVFKGRAFISEIGAKNSQVERSDGANVVPLYTHPAPTAQDSNWEPSECEYDRSIHGNPDYEAWADLFMQTFPNCGADRDTMATWFANAMMAKHDSMAQDSKVPEYRNALVALTEAEAQYRYIHDLHGSGHLETGRAWDAMRRAGDSARLLLSAAPVPDKLQCEYCDGTGDVHSVGGEWRGRCDCPAGLQRPEAPEGE